MYNHEFHVQVFPTIFNFNLRALFQIELGRKYFEFRFLINGIQCVSYEKKHEGIPRLR
jgi:hypothetical protein